VLVGEDEAELRVLDWSPHRLDRRHCGSSLRVSGRC
jgi:hypothetical protein